MTESHDCQQLAASHDADVEAFLAFVAGWADLPREAVGLDTRLVDDLQLDSLRLTELVVALLDAYPAGGLISVLDAHDWDSVTCGQVFSICTQAQA